MFRPRRLFGSQINWNRQAHHRWRRCSRSNTAGSLGSSKRARKEAGLTQREVPRFLNRPQSLVSKLESGERRVDPIELLRLAKLYGKPFAYFPE